MSQFKNYIEKDKIQLEEIENMIDDVERDLEDHIKEVEDKIHKPTANYNNSNGSLSISFGYIPVKDEE
jgi:hypothetical protein